MVLFRLFVKLTRQDSNADPIIDLTLHALQAPAAAPAAVPVAASEAIQKKRNAPRAATKGAHKVDDSSFDEGGEDDESEEAVPAKKQRVKGSGAKKKPGRMADGLTVEQHRRKLGDVVKARIRVEKWCVEATTHATTECTEEVFRSVIVPHAVVTPANFNSTTPVVSALVNGYDHIGEVCGRSKITGGTRLGSWHARKMEFIYIPSTGELRIWWIMG
jgi:hypothetical protein